LIPADSAGGGWIQADRGARPNQTPFLTGDQNDAYLAGEPAADRYMKEVGDILPG
jgi:hypothetical protein